MLDVNTSEYDETFEELCAVLKKKRFVNPSRFEELIGCFFKNIGYTIEYTNKTRDGGYDLILLINGEKYAIVEVKDWKNKISVELIRQLRGVQFETKSKQAYFVTSSSFTNDAIISAAKSISNHQINLYDAEAILKLLKIKRSQTSLAELNQRYELFSPLSTNIIDSAYLFNEKFAPYSSNSSMLIGMTSLKKPDNCIEDFVYVWNVEIIIDYQWFEVDVDLIKDRSENALKQKADIFSEKIYLELLQDKRETEQEKIQFIDLIKNHFIKNEVINKLYLNDMEERTGLRNFYSIPSFQKIKLNNSKYIEFEIFQGSWKDKCSISVRKRDFSKKKNWTSLIK